MAKINSICQFGDTEKAEILVVKFLPNLREGKLFGVESDKIIRESLEQYGMLLNPSLIFFSSLITDDYDPELKGRARTLHISEISQHLELLLVRLKNLKVIITLGKEVKEYFCDDSVSLTKSIGRSYKKDFGYGEISILTNFSERAAFSYPEKFKSKFLSVFSHANNILKGEIKSVPYKVDYLTYDKFLSYADRLLDYYYNGMIDSVAFDIETTNAYGSRDSLTSLAHSQKEYITGFSMADSKERVGYYINLYHPRFADKIGEETAREQERLVTNKLISILETIPVYCHNSKFDLLWSHTKLGLNLSKVKLIDDTLALAFLLLGAKRDTGIELGLKPLCKLYFGFNESWDEAIDLEMLKFNKIDDRRLINIPFQVLADYGGMDSIAMLHLRETLRGEIEKDSNKEILEAYDLLLKAILVFTDIESNNVPIHFDLLRYLKDLYSREVSNLDESLNNMDSALEFKRKKVIENNNSPLSEGEISELSKSEIIPVKGKKISEFLFDYLNLPKDKFVTEKGAPSLNREARMYWVDNAPTEEQKTAVSYLTKSIEVNDQLSKYIIPIENQINKFGGYYTDYRLTSVTTGRLGSPFHTLPSFGDIKYLVVSDWQKEGGLVMAPDYSQVEVRVMASLSGDKDLRQAYIDGLDIHKFVASKTFDIPYDEVPKLKRSYAKTVIFGMLYGESVWTLAEKLEKTVEEAQEIQDSVFNRFPKIKKWIDKTISDGENLGYVSSRLGRRRSLAALRDFKRSKNDRERKLYSAAKRAAMNHPIQSTASDITLSSIVKLHTELKKLNMKSRFIGTVHDSLELSIHPSEILKSIILIKYCCEEDLSNRFNWLNGVPYHIDIEMGVSWGNCLDVDFELSEITEDEGILEISGRDLGYNSFISQIQKNPYFELEILEEERFIENPETDNSRVFHGIVCLTSKEKVKSKIKLKKIR